MDKNAGNVRKCLDPKVILVPLLLRTEVECGKGLLLILKTLQILSGCLVKPRSLPTYYETSSETQGQLVEGGLRGWLWKHLPLQNISDYFCYTGGLFICSIRVDSYDPAGLGYSDKCVELEKTGKWSLVLKENRELHATPNEERFRYCYLITYKILK